MLSVLHSFFTVCLFVFFFLCTFQPGPYIGTHPKWGVGSVLRFSSDCRLEMSSVFLRSADDDINDADDTFAGADHSAKVLMMEVLRIMPCPVTSDVMITLTGSNQKLLHLYISHQSIYKAVK